MAVQYFNLTNQLPLSFQTNVDLWASWIDWTIGFFFVKASCNFLLPLWIASSATPRQIYFCWISFSHCFILSFCSIFFAFCLNSSTSFLFSTSSCSAIFFLWAKSFWYFCRDCFTESNKPLLTGKSNTPPTCNSLSQTRQRATSVFSPRLAPSDARIALLRENPRSGAALPWDSDRMHFYKCRKLRIFLLSKVISKWKGEKTCDQQLSIRTWLLAGISGTKSIQATLTFHR